MVFGLRFLGPLAFRALGGNQFPPLTDGMGGTESPIGGTESPIGGTESPLLSSDLNPSSSGADRSQAANPASHGTKRRTPPEALIVAERGATPESVPLHRCSVPRFCSRSVATRRSHFLGAPLGDVRFVLLPSFR